MCVIQLHITHHFVGTNEITFTHVMSSNTAL